MANNETQSDASQSQAELGDETDVVTVDDVQEWLDKIGHGEYKETFRANGIDGDVLKTLTSEELRTDLKVVNLRDRRDILNAVQKLTMATKAVPTEGLPEHGRILDHLSNVRTYHSWIRVGVQMLGFSIVTLRLTPNLVEKGVITAASIYFAIIGSSALLYGIYRYRNVITMIEKSGAKSPAYDPDRFGVWTMLGMVGIASMIVLALIIRRLV